MRHPVLTLLLVLCSTLASAFAAPLVPGAHAQSASAVVTVTPSTVPVGATVTVSGSGFTPDCYAYVYWIRPNGTSSGTYVYSSSSGAFSLQLGVLATNGAGSEYLTAYDYCRGQWMPYFVVSVQATTVVTVPTLAADPPAVTAGAGTSKITGTDFTPNSYVYVTYTRPNGTTNAVYVYTTGAGDFEVTLRFLQTNGCGTADAPRYETVRAYDFGTSTWSSTFTVAVDCPSSGGQGQ